MADMTTHPARQELVEALRVAREYVVDGVSLADRELEEVAGFPSLEDRKKHLLDQAKADLALVDAALSAARSGLIKQTIPFDQAEQAARCECRGADEWCPCQNVADPVTRAAALDREEMAHGE